MATKHPPPSYPDILNIAQITIFLWSLITSAVQEIPLLTLISSFFSVLLFAVFIIPTRILLYQLRHYLSSTSQSQSPSTLQVAIVGLVHHAFEHFPHTIGRVFFSEEGSLSYMVSRIGGRQHFQRHCWKRRNPDNGLEGWWVSPGENPQNIRDSDVGILYLHGGGFVMGSPAFYLEVLYKLTCELQLLGFHRPMIFAPVYGLAPEATFPSQIQTAARAWEHLQQSSKPGALLGIAGDSAGGGLATALMLAIAKGDVDRKPDFATLISPWTSLRTPATVGNDLFDFVSPLALQHFAHLYSSAQELPHKPSFWTYLSDLTHLSTFLVDPPDVKSRHEELCLQHPLLSPLEAGDDEIWRRALPRLGIQISYGSREVLARQCHQLVHQWERICGKDKVRSRQWPFCHAPAMVYLYLGRSERERRQGVKDIADFIFEASEGKFIRAR